MTEWTDDTQRRLESLAVDIVETPEDIADADAIRAALARIDELEERRVLGLPAFAEIIADELKHRGATPSDGCELEPWDRVFFGKPSAPAIASRPCVCGGQLQFASRGDYLCGQWQCDKCTRLFSATVYETIGGLRAERDALRQRVERLTAVVKLIIGRRLGIPWPEVQDSEVEGYLQSAALRVDEGCSGVRTPLGIGSS